MTELETKITRSARRFDLISLIRLLHHAGYGRDEILFRSEFSLLSQISLIHAVHFIPEPTRRVEIVLNLGLLSVQGALPSYFALELGRESINEQRFHEFVGYFEHVLIDHLVRALYPELNVDLIPDWRANIRRYLLMVDLRSISGLTWLFQLAFPELGVRVEKRRLSRNIRTESLRLGRVKLGGDAVFGKSSGLPLNGQVVSIYCDEELDQRGRPWPQEIRRRLKTLVFPILRQVEIDLEIDLVIRDRTTFARLDQQSVLGYDRIKGGEAAARRVRLFQGYLSNQASAAPPDAVATTGNG